MNKVFVACAGSGKTTQIIYEACEYTNKKILVTTFTDNNVDEIRKKFYQINGTIPNNVTILPWFSFQLKHLIKPYLNPLLGNDISGICMVSGTSAMYTSEANKEHYINKSNQVYSDKLPKLSTKMLNCDNFTLNRLIRLFDVIFIDEFQDFAGYDLQILKLLMKTQLDIFLFCDPRQHTFSTNHSIKNKKYSSCSLDFIKDNCKQCIVDEKTLNDSRRCPEKSIVFASSIFPEYPVSHSHKFFQEEDGIFFVESSKVDEFLSTNDPLQLRDSIKQKTNDSFRTLNFGNSKGLTVDNVLIYPTKPMKDSIIKMDFSILKPEAKSNLYVALTRARHKTGIIIDDGTLDKYSKAIVFLDSIKNETKDKHDY